MPVLSDEDERKRVSDSFNQSTGNASGLKRLFGMSGDDSMTQAIKNRRSKIDPDQPDDSEENNQGVE